MSAELAYLEEVPRFGFLVDRCERCGYYRAGMEVVYTAHWSYMDPPDYDEAWVCPRCIAEAEVNDVAADIEMFESHVAELEASGDPEAETERRALELELYRFEQMARQVKARFEYLEET